MLKSSEHLSTFNFHKPIKYCTLLLQLDYIPIMLWCIHCVYVRGCICLQKCFFSASAGRSRRSCGGTQDTAVVDELYLSLSESNSCWRWWHLSASVTTQLALVFHAARQIDSPQSCSALADSQTALIGTNKSSFMHYSKVDSGASFKFNRGRLPSGHICQVI